MSLILFQTETKLASHMTAFNIARAVYFSRSVNSFVHFCNACPFLHILIDLSKKYFWVQ